MQASQTADQVMFSEILIAILIKILIKKLFNLFQAIVTNTKEQNS